jgi:Cof subfamily protein (haloacid dehalogenase superfamily)
LLDIKALVLDLDGTLLNSNKSISPRNYQTVKRCFDYGIHVIVATARPPRVAEQFVRDIPFADYRVFYNGALVTCTSQQIRRHYSIPMEISKQITEFIKSSDPRAMLSYEVNDSWYTCTPILDTQCSKLGIRQTDPRPQVVDVNFINSLSPTKILVLGYDTWQDVVQTFGDKVNVLATDGGMLVQIVDKSASKETALQWVLNEIGVMPENVMVFGDDYNDVGLFRVCGYPIAMGNAIDELKKSAKYVTESNDDDGVAVALEKLLLSTYHI